MQRYLIRIFPTLILRGRVVRVVRVPDPPVRRVRVPQDPREILDPRVRVEPFSFSWMAEMIRVRVRRAER